MQSRDRYGKKPSLFAKWILRVPILRGIVARSPNFCELSLDSGSSRDNDPLFLIVHGTWSRDAAWTGQNSKLVDELKSRWPKAGFYRFKWSGVNGARARIVAATALAGSLDELKVGYPSSKIIAISHSHGGNVVAWACTEITRSIDAAIYLSTPFLHVQQQVKPGSSLLKLFLIGFPILSLILVGRIAKLYPELPFAKQFWGIRHPYCLIPFGAAAVLLPFLLTPEVNRVRRDLARLSGGDRKVNKELVVSVLGDEAVGFLTSVYFTQWVGVRSVSILFVCCFAALDVAALIDKWSFLIDINFSWAAIIILICFATFSLITLVAFAGQGITQGLVGLDSSTAITSAPVGRPDYESIGWIKPVRRRDLRHSAVLQEPEAIRKIIRWLEGSGFADDRF